MPITVGGTTITFNDATTQSTAATAGSLVTTANVLSATAGASAGAVGTYMFASASTSNIAFGSTIAGSSLRPVSASWTVGFTPAAAASAAFTQGATQAGTWRAMGTYTYTANNGYGGSIYGATLWLRIS